MNVHEQLIEEFYAGFAAHDPETMLSCYHEDVVFTDPVFGTLHGDDVADMWRMLIDRAQGNLQIEFSGIRADNAIGEANWVATYNYGKAGRAVVNEIAASFEFKDDLIIRHTDTFNMHKWAKQALGAQGVLFGWTPFMHKKIQQKAIMHLRKFQQKK